MPSRRMVEACIHNSLSLQQQDVYRLYKASYVKDKSYSTKN